MTYNLNKETIQNQLIFRGVTNPEILEAFQGVDREEFVPPEYRRIAYADMEIPVSESEVFLRAYATAKMLECLLDLPRNSTVLVFEDCTGYTTIVTKHIFPNVVSTKIEQVSELEQKFDAIFFDSGVFSNKYIREITTRFLVPEGRLIRLERPVSGEISPASLSFDAGVSNLTCDGKLILPGLHTQKKLPA